MRNHTLAEQVELRARLSAGLRQLAVSPRADVFDIAITPCELNERHGTGVLLKSIFGAGAGFLSIRSRDVYEGEHTFGDVSVCLAQTGSDAMSSLARVLDGKVPRRILSVPYYPDDVQSTIAIKNRFGAPLCTYLMDDQNVFVGGIPDDQMKTLLAVSDVRLGISRDLCEAYESKYGFKFWFLPAVAPSSLILDTAVSPAKDLESRRGVLLGNLWSQRWLDRLRAITYDTGVRLDWYGNPRRDWLSFDEAELGRDGIVFLGYVPDRELTDRLRQYPYAVVPTGSSDDAGDRPEFARLSLPSRISYLLATANTPIILLGRADSAAGHFVEQLGIGVVSPYDPERFRAAVGHVCRPEIQSAMRTRAAGLARAFSSDGMADWIWSSLAAGEPCDSRFEALMPRGLGSAAASGAPTTAAVQQADVVITGNEVTDKHGTGALVRRIFGRARNVFSIRSFNHYGGDHSFGDASVCLNEVAGVSRPEVFQNVLTALRGSSIQRIFCVPYFREDFLTAIAVRDLYGAPLVAWIMDDQNVSANGVSDALMSEFLTRCSLRFATHPELRDAYERKFGLKCWLLPAVVTDRLIRTEALATQGEIPAPKAGALLGSIWSERWFEMLWRTLQGAGVTLDWYGNSEYYWLRDSRDDLRKKRLIPYGVVPEDQLAERLRTHSYVVVPTGTRDHRDDRPELSALSLPGRILFALATAHTPVIILGSRRTSAARFVERFEVGLVCDYDASAFREAVAYISQNEVQDRMRLNAARAAGRFSDSGIDEWVWRSLDRGEPCDPRFEELMPWSSDDMGVRPLRGGLQPREAGGIKAPSGAQERGRIMDAEANDSSGSVVKHLARLPIIDRVRVVKDLMLRELGGIHSHVSAVHEVADALLANDWRLLRELDAICEEVAGVRTAGNALLADDSPLRRELDLIRTRIVAVHAAAGEVLANDSRVMRELEVVHAEIEAVRTAGAAVLAENSLLRRELEAIHSEVAAVETKADAVLASDSRSVRELEAIHSEVAAVETKADAVLASGSRLACELDVVRALVEEARTAGEAVLAEGSPLRGELAAIHGEVAVVQANTDAMLANDSPLLQASASLVEAVQQARLEVDRQGQILLNSIRQARQERQRQMEGLQAAVGSGQEESTRRGSLLLDVLRDVQQKLENESRGLMEALRGIREETTQHGSFLLEVLRDGQDRVESRHQGLLGILEGVEREARRQEQGLLEALRSEHEETRQHQLLLAEMLRQSEAGGVGRSEALGGAVQETHQETRGRLHELINALKETNAAIKEQGTVVSDALGEAQKGAVQQRSLIAAALKDIHAGLGEERQLLRDAVGRVRGAVQETHQETSGRLHEVIDTLKETSAAIREQGTVLSHGLGEVQMGTGQQGSRIEAGLRDIQVRLGEERQLLQDAVGRVRVEPTDTLQGRAILLRDGESAAEPEVDLMAHLYSFLPSRTAVDIGANVGDVSNRLLEAGYEVYAFEPNSTVFYHLNDRLGRHIDFHCFPWALGSIDETRQLHTASDLSGANVYRDATLYSSLTHHSMPDDLVFSGSVSVSVRSLESLHASRHVPVSLGLVKIDTEGFDLEVIRGMGPHRYPVVVAEYWDPTIPFGVSGAMNRLDDMVKEMKGRGYHWYVVFYRIWGKDGVSFYCNHPRSVEHTYGNVFFFQDHNVFAQALLWCSAVLPATYVGR